MSATLAAKSLVLQIAQLTGSAILRPLLTAMGARQLLNTAYGYLLGRVKVVL